MVLRPTFPRGWPGVGLLLLRVVVGAAFAGHGGRAIAGANGMPAVLSVGAAAILLGIALMGGLFTPIAAGLASAGTIAVAFGWIPGCPPDLVRFASTTLFIVSMSVAVLLLGPGAISLDARRRGHREIVIPPVARTGSEPEAE